MNDEKDDMSTRRLNSEEVNRKAKNKKVDASSETQVVGKINLDDANSKKSKKNSKNEKKNNKGKKKKFKERHPRIATIIRIILILILLCIIIIAGIIAGAIWGGFNFFELLGADYKINIEDLVIQYENSIVYDADGNKLCELSAGTKRRVVSLDEMSEYLPKAYIAIEDERFYEHSGVDFKRTAAATFTYITNGGSSSFGGSTITQQVVKNITGDKEDSALRKVKEMVKALQVEHYLSKDQILELYLNLIFVGGEDVNGVALGSVYYFNKDVKDLSIAECAYLAGINHSPNAYLPFKEYENEEDKNKMSDKIKTRTKTVLGKMKELGYITEEQYNESVTEVDNGLAFSNGDTNTTTLVSYQTEAAIEEIINQMVDEKEGMTKDLAEIKLYSGGYKIYTTQKTNVQTRLEEELSSSKYDVTSKSGQKGMSSMVIIEPSTGNVVAASARAEDGSTQTYLGYFNLTTDMLKQTGSSIKPLAVTCPGLESGKLTASSMFYDGPTTFPGNYTPGEWYPGYKGLISMRTATEVSSNIPHVKALSTIGLETGVEFLQKMNFDDVTGKEGLALALGGFTNGASTLQMASGYAMIANDGVYIKPTFYTQVLDDEGNVYISSASVEDRSTTMMSKSNAYIMKSMLNSVVTGPSGTATYCAISGMDVAAKTGTTNQDMDRWLCGFTNYYAGACWFGFNEKEEVIPNNAHTAGAIWSSVMKDIHTDLEPSKFDVPDDIVTVAICSDSGMAATDKCNSTYPEIFVNGTVPGACDIHGNSIEICNSTGLIASEFCEDHYTRYYKVAPSSESSGNWTTTYNGEFTTNIPTDVCPHTARSYTYED